jgi:hypothetical protein
MERNPVEVGINEQAQTEVATEISAPPKALCKNLGDKWFVHNESGAIWHLIWPDITPDFDGNWSLQVRVS